VGLPEDIIRKQLLKQAAAALVAAGSILTDEQSLLVGTACENQRREAVSTLLLMDQPPQSMRSFPLLQLLTRGKPTDFAVEAHGLVVLICCALARAQTDNDFRDKLFGFAREDLRAGKLNLGGMKFYEQGAKGAGADAIAELGQTVSPQELYAAVSASPNRYGSGYAGMTSVKGRLSTTYGSQIESRAERHSVGDMVRAAGGSFEEGE